MFDSMPNLKVRPVTSEDTQFVFDLFTSVRGAKLQHTELTYDQKIKFLNHQYHAMHSDYATRYPDGEHYIVMRRNKPIGRLYINLSEDELRILDVIIFPNKRSKGYGSEIMEAIIAHSEETGVPLRFYVWVENYDAQRFYKRHGCDIIENQAGYLLYERHPQKEKA